MTDDPELTNPIDPLDWWRPTPEMRFVEREAGERKLRILQQKWTGPGNGNDAEWRDVPLVGVDV